MKHLNSPNAMKSLGFRSRPPQRIRYTTKLSYALISMSLMASCSPPQRSMKDSTLAGNHRAAASANRLRLEQEKVLYKFDAAITHGETACRALCQGQTDICRIATQICTVADDSENNRDALLTCRRATETCRETTKRLPQNCWCQ
ncbi:MAG: hypothetical protein VX223_12380 [Myxococcota bacterium]|nr:hypothetical protein [Myxococcota bacterium]